MKNQRLKCLMIALGFALAGPANAQLIRDLRNMAMTRPNAPPETSGPSTVGKSSFPGQPLVTLLHGRDIRLEQDYGYRDSGGRWWPVPAKTKSDGASIPRLFWSVVGGPLDGPYRNAAIIHDYYCASKSRPWRAVHRMFYDAMIASGVGGIEAKLKFYAVYRFGPRWAYSENGILVCGRFDRCANLARTRTLPQEPIDVKSAEIDKTLILKNNMSLSDIEDLADKSATKVASR